jgi:hypothetical protein
LGENEMITAREKIQIGLGVIGLSLFGLGMAFYNFGAEKKEIRTYEHRVGFWKDSGMTEDSEKKMAPWMLGCGIAAVATAYIIRQK